ncbi:Tyrosine recombinase XerC [bioreactor metagenome]|uniref:Tyrosine recombinase XerC n=1 Tax=bioreactor metagenome TaxID=1076179 RepID=A0A644WX54_9ZZZZ
MAVSLRIKNDIYHAVFRIVDQDGNSHQKSVSTKISATGHHKREAMKIAEKIVEKYQESKIDYKKILFSEWVEQWLEQKMLSIDTITYDGYKSYVINHILPYFSSQKCLLQNISPQDIQLYYKRKSECLSGKSLRNHHVVISGALNDALKKNLIPYNPATRVEIPKKKKFTANYYTAEQATNLLVALTNSDIGDVVTIALYYGMRRSEILGLKWGAIDFDAGNLEVKATVVRFSKVVEKEVTKTQSSNRTYPLLPLIRKMLLKRRSKQAEYRLLYGNEYKESEYVFTWPDGRSLLPDYVTRKFSEELQKHMLPQIRFHDLRHTTASLLIAQGFQLKDIQEWLGHGDIGTTANIYGHLDYKRKEVIGNGIDGILGLKKPS